MKRMGRLLLILALAGALLAAAGRLREAKRYITYLGESLPLQSGVARNPYSEQDFTAANGRVSYLGGERRAMAVVDVSLWQGEIDWQAVAADGVEGAMLRVGCRGYGSETGVLVADERFHENLRGAKAAGLQVGAYFFSQATSEEEAREEARFALSLLDGAALELPLAFDWETVGSETARTAHVTGGELTACAIAFCDEVADAGYQPMVYFNQDTAYRMYDLAALGEIPFWLAEYDAYPSFAYDFALWQYTSAGAVKGIGTAVDLNLWLH